MGFRISVLIRLVGFRKSLGLMAAQVYAEGLVPGYRVQGSGFMVYGSGFKPKTLQHQATYSTYLPGLSLSAMIMEKGLSHQGIRV